MQSKDTIFLNFGLLNSFAVHFISMEDTSFHSITDAMQSILCYEMHSR